MNVSDYINEPGKPVRIWEGDCLELMREMEDGCVDAVVTDPPYNLGARTFFTANRATGEVFSRSQSLGEWDEGFPLESFAKDMIRVTRNVLMAFASDGQIPVWLALLPDAVIGAWVKTNPMPHLRPSAVRRVHEHLILWGPVGGDSVIVAPTDTTTFAGGRPRHPTLKPEWVIECLVARARPGDLILDPFLGSGTTGAVCDRLGRRWIAAEISPTYVQMATERIERARQQLKLPMEV